MNRRQTAVSAVVAALVVIGWALVNPGGAFGLSRFGVTTYNRLPIPAFDVQVREDGSLHVLSKSHNSDSERLAWLLAPRPPEVLVIGLGWRDRAKVAADVHPPKGTKVIAVNTEEALGLYNALKAKGMRVAIHVHSTC